VRFLPKVIDIFNFLTILIIEDVERDDDMSIYDKLPVDVLVVFYYEILKNIEQGILTERMYAELELIYAAAERKDVTM
jgi:hypothetical protein